MLGPRAAAFDDDDTPEDYIDADLKDDPVSTMDMTVSYDLNFTNRRPFSPMSNVAQSLVF